MLTHYCLLYESPVTNDYPVAPSVTHCADDQTHSLSCALETLLLPMALTTVLSALSAAALPIWHCMRSLATCIGTASAADIASASR
mmetsp:Transcript_24712/g.52405  ORF Transcript_24712/g.52405 Transcript_24712/m.52405 type:complete len:86 (-) Transcript_24712:485-742(-)